MENDVSIVVGAVLLALHGAWILWIVAGALFTKGRPVLAVLHVGSLLWGLAVELTSLRCPVTVAEQLVQARAGGAYRGGFVVHYLDRVLWPTIPENVIVFVAVGICLANLAVYAGRLMSQDHPVQTRSTYPTAKPASLRQI